MSTYICKCGQRVQKSSSADNTGNRLKGYGPGHECYGCPYAMPWGGNEWDETAKRFVQDIKGYECRMSRTLSYASQFIGSIKDKCTCSVVSLDFDFLEQISAWVKDTFPLGEITGNFSRDEIRPTDYSHNGRYCCTFVCASNKKGIAAKAALFARFFNPDGSRKDITPQQEMEKILADIEKAKEDPTCATVPNADAAATTAESAVPNAAAATQTTSESAEGASALIPAVSPQTCESAPGASADGSFPATSAAMGSTPTVFDFSALGDLSAQAVETDRQFDLHYGTAQDEYLISCIYVAKMHALTAKAGRYGGGTWTKWYESKGIGAASVHRMLQTGEGFKSSTMEDLKCLPELTRKDLNLIARSGCAEQLTAAAGDSQRVQELLAQLKNKDDAIAAEKDRADTAEAQRDAAQADVAGLHEQNGQLKKNLDAANANIRGLTESYNVAKKNELAQCDHLKDLTNQLEGSRQVAEAAKLRADKLKAENDALKKQPITAVVDEDEVDRRAGEKAYEIAAGMTADYKAQQEQDARDAYDSIILAGRSITSIVQSTKLQFRKLPDDQRETAINQFVHTLASAQGEVSACL